MTNEHFLKICAAHFQGASENGRKWGSHLTANFSNKPGKMAVSAAFGEWRVQQVTLDEPDLLVHGLGNSGLSSTGEAPMLTRSLSLLTAVLAVGVYAGNLRAQQSPAALSGIVSSAKDGAMEGVVVSAKR